MANTSDQGCSSVANMANSPLPPKFVSLMKSARKAKFDAEMFASRIDLLARQYSRGFDEILREGTTETRDGVICDIATEMDVEVSSYSGKLEDFKTKLKNVVGNHDNNSQSKDGPLPGDSPLGIQEELRDRMVKLQQQIRNMEDSFHKRFEPATARNEENTLEITALKKQLAEALDSNRKLQQQILDMDSSNTAFQKPIEDATAQNAERLEEVTTLQKQLGEALEANRKLKDDFIQMIPIHPVAATVDGSVQTYDTDFPSMCSQVELEFCKLINKLEEHEESLLEEIRILNVKIKLEIREKAGSVAHLGYVKSLAHYRVMLALIKVWIEHPNILTPLFT